MKFSHFFYHLGHFIDGFFWVSLVLDVFQCNSSIYTDTQVIVVLSASVWICSVVCVFERESSLCVSWIYGFLRIWVYDGEILMLQIQTKVVEALGKYRCSVTCEYWLKRLVFSEFEWKNVVNYILRFLHRLLIYIDWKYLLLICR